ncbi:hypothetical protein IM792_05625 [Mucilaginibacter sp. JRF]|uniref:hypothetical protein n=1 Tax=Mucilaginibacter sp. JRF TaxID=2780088 RepID=UPI00188063C2|nr:hypothetical protein [Mucilaginibacter sp. JRF]MBE9583920.1 hypothetical protein [Mucilaginibacter sp. JRF]
MHKRGFLSKNWLKVTNKAEYKTYKRFLEEERRLNEFLFLYKKQRLNDREVYTLKARETGELNFSHSGNAGDIIYALPTIKKIQEITGTRVNLYLKLDQPLELKPGYKHPLGNVMLNQKMVDMLLPLISKQPYITYCGVNTGQEIDIDLDFFRNGPMPLDKGNIARWCGYITGINPDLGSAWLTVEANKEYNDTIIIARSERYQNITIDHSFLNDYKNVVFVGVKSEYDAIKTKLSGIEWVRVDDFLQLAEMIAGCKFFIGNQSFPFSVAEGLKVKRVLETSFEVINVIPEGPNAFDFFFQQHFEHLVHELNS